jgi:hypothetical protein
MSYLSKRGIGQFSGISNRVAWSSWHESDSLASVAFCFSLWYDVCINPSIVSSYPSSDSCCGREVLSYGWPIIVLEPNLDSGWPFASSGDLASGV